MLFRSVAKRADQQARLYARLPELQMWRGLTPPAIDISALVSDAGALVVEYLVADDELLIVSIARGETAPASPPASPKPPGGEGGEPRGGEGGKLGGDGGAITAVVISQKRRELADKIEQAMQTSVLHDVVNWRQQTRPIAAALLDPIAGRLRDRDRLVIVPDDVLWRVPFEALPVGETDLASRVRVTYASSLATLAAQRRAADRASTPEHLIAGIAAAPAIPAAIRAQVTLTSQGWREPDTAASLASAGEIARLYGDAATLRTAGDATESAVRALLETSDVVHVQAPLQVSGPTPLFSSVLLGGVADAAENDGRWEAREWFNLNGRARVLVIPDAATFGAAGAGGAMDILAWAAAAANVSALVVGRWPADGFAPDLLVFLSALHAQLAKGMPIGDAWGRATVSAREQAGAAPAGWAGLRLLGGDPR